MKEQAVKNIIIFEWALNMTKHRDYPLLVEEFYGKMSGRYLPVTAGLAGSGERELITGGVTLWFLFT
ncbi:MAG: hypothetical protein DSY80_06140 [Desulfocapsa sp.]|nr:MAG: hypothetical protein DSY80_06140 [Desulfocapsa sp.]